MSVPTPPRLRPRTEPHLAARLTRSAAATEGAQLGAGEVPGWLAARSRAHDFRVEPVPFAELEGWSFDKTSGNLVHSSGRFFSVEGLQVRVENASGQDEARQWCQPVLNQPEIGILGLLVKEFDGVAHFLMQAKMEPGNPGLLQLSPTVQATWSNYNRVHRGAPVRYLEHFTRPGRGRVLSDVLQSEQGAWFYHKVNRNMIVEAHDDVPPHEDFRWLTLGQITKLLHGDNVVSMDTRSVLSCLPFEQPETGALHTDPEVLSWFTDVRSRYAVHADRIKLADVPGWAKAESAIEHEHGRYFRIIGVSVQAGSREVASWTQPLLEPCGAGIAAFLACRINGVRHMLAHARTDGGFVNSVELAPTVQCTPGNYAHLPAAEQPAFLDQVLSADPAQIRYSAIQSEEGGRFHKAETHYLVIDVGEPFEPPADYHWVTHGQLNTLVQHGHYLNVEARTLLAALNALAVAA
jgi:oxidase EvaA